MNYIKLITNFWKAHELHTFNTTEMALYFHLCEVANVCNWPSSFKRNNARVKADINMTSKGLKNARTKLQDAGLITFQQQPRNANVSYTLIELEYKKETNYHQKGMQEGVQSLPAKDKLNKTKRNKSSSSTTTTTTNFLNKEEWEPSQHSAPNMPVIPTYEDVVEAFTENGGTEEMAKRFYDKNTITGWHINNSPIKSFLQLVPGFIKGWNKILKNENQKPHLSKSLSHTSKQQSNGEAYLQQRKKAEEWERKMGLV